jgi:hypothetical protein
MAVVVLLLGLLHRRTCCARCYSQHCWPGEPRAAAAAAAAEQGYAQVPGGNDLFTSVVLPGYSAAVSAS